MRFLALMAFCLVFFTSFSQRIAKDTILSTGFIPTTSSNNRMGYLVLRELNDSLVYIDYSYQFSANVHIANRLTYETSTLTQIKQETIYDQNSGSNILIPNSGGPGLFGGYNIFLTDEKYNKTYNLDYFINKQNQIELYFYTIDQQFQKDSLLFSFVDAMSPIPASDPFLYDSTLYFYTTRPTKDTFDIRALDLQSNLVAQNEFFPDSQLRIGVSSEFPFHNWHEGPVRTHPANDSLLIFEYINESLTFLNRFTLDTAGYLIIDNAQRSQLLVTDHWGGMGIKEFEYHPTFVRMFGRVDQFPFILTSPNLYKDWDLAYMDVDYQGNIIDHKEYGNDTIHAEAGDYDSEGGWKYFAGSEPHFINAIYAREKRQVLIYRDSANVVDSVYLYGTKNHRVDAIKANDRGQLLVLSRFSNAWTDDSIYIQISVVDFNLITNIKKINPTHTSLVVYPNPTQEYLKSDQFSEDLNYKIYSTQGQLVKEGRISSGNYIRVNELGKGSYVLVILENELMRPRSIHFVKE